MMKHETPIQVRPVRPESDVPAVRRLYVSGILEGDNFPSQNATDIENLVEAYLSDDGASHFWVAQLQAGSVVNNNIQSLKDICEIVHDHNHPVSNGIAIHHDQAHGDRTLHERSDNMIVGMIGAKRTDEEIIEIRRLCVDPAHRKCGIGKRLIETALDFCHERGYLKVRLDTHAERFPAIALFEKFGFQLNRTRNINGTFVHDFYLNLYKRCDADLSHSSS